MDRDSVNEAYSKSLKDKKPYSIDHRLKMSDGRIKEVPLTEEGMKGIIKRLRKKLPENCIDNTFGVEYRFGVLSK